MRQEPQVSYAAELVREVRTDRKLPLKEVAQVSGYSMRDAFSAESFVPLRQAATRLGVPVAWLRAEAEAGRVPHLRVGRRLMANPQEVEQVLLERARRAAPGAETAELGE